MEDAFKEYIACPRKEEIKRVFMGDDGLYGIMMREGFNRCYVNGLTLSLQKRPTRNVTFFLERP